MFVDRRLTVGDLLQIQQAAVGTRGIDLPEGSPELVDFKRLEFHPAGCDLTQVAAGRFAPRGLLIFRGIDAVQPDFDRLTLAGQTHGVAVEHLVQGADPAGW